MEMEKKVSMDGKRVVNVLRKSVVKPDKETPKEKVWLSNIDLVSAFMTYTPIIYVYRYPQQSSATEEFFPFDGIKASLAKTLSVFHIYAGKLDYDETGRPEIHCTGDGVEFFEAACDLSIEEFGELIPGQELEDLLVPRNTSQQPPYMLVRYQVTRFKCGGVIIGLLTHHTTGDGINSVRFFNAWADVHRGVLDVAKIPPPVLDRTGLRARSPPLVEYEHSEYRMPVKTLPPMASGNSINPTITKTLRLSKEEVANLKSKASAENLVATTFTAVVAHSWKCITRARKLSPDQTTRLLIGCDSKAIVNPPLSPLLNANAIVHLSATMTVEEMVSCDLNRVATKIEEAKSFAHDKYVRSVVDFLEVRDGTRGVPPVQSTEVLAISWMRLPMYEADFGWGKPEFMGRAGIPYPGRLYLGKRTGDDGIWVTTTLEENYIGEFIKLFYGEVNGVVPQKVINEENGVVTQKVIGEPNGVVTQKVISEADDVVPK